MKDYLGNEIAVGDTVIVIRPGYREFVDATVERITDKFVFLTYDAHWGLVTEVKQAGKQVIRKPKDA